MEEIVKKITLYKEVCPHCGEELISQYKDQLEYNYKTHTESCKRKKEERRNGHA